MRLKKIDLMENVHSAEATIKLLNLLEDFRIPHAKEVNTDAKYIHDSEMCHDCGDHHDNCLCGEQSYGGRYMAEYDDEAGYED